MTNDVEHDADEDYDAPTMRPSDTLSLLCNPSWSQLSEPVQYDFFKRAGLSFPWPRIRVVSEYRDNEV